MYDVSGPLSKLPLFYRMAFLPPSFDKILLILHGPDARSLLLSSLPWALSAHLNSCLLCICHWNEMYFEALMATSMFWSMFANQFLLKQNIHNVKQCLKSEYCTESLSLCFRAGHKTCSVRVRQSLMLSWWQRTNTSEAGCARTLPGEYITALV